MTLVNWTPFGELNSMNKCLNRFFDRPFTGRDEDSRKDADCLATWHPTTDIYDTKDNYVLKMELPGLKKEEVNIEFENNTLSVSGERKEEKDVKKDDYHWTERYNGKFHRAFRLPKNVDGEKINASMKDGILELKVAKPEEKKPKDISIAVN